MNSILACRFGPRLWLQTCSRVATQTFLFLLYCTAAIGFYHVGAADSIRTTSASGGAVEVWGDSSFGQFPAPKEAQSGVIAIAVGAFHIAALKSDGSVVAWGLNEHGQTTVPVAARSGVTAIAAGAAHTVALKSDGSVVAWGYNGNGQTSVPASAQSGVKAIAAGGGHTVALKTDGSMVAWGLNEGGQTTVPIEALSGVIAIAAGSEHTAALKQDGSVVAWGRNGCGQITVPEAAKAGVVAIAAGTCHTVALKSDGSVVAWGLGQTSVPVAAQSGVVAIASGDSHILALKANGTVVAWGYNNEGQVSGTPTGDDLSATASPVTLRGEILRGVVAIAGGALHSVALYNPTAPAITSSLMNRTAYLGQKVSFTASAAGYPTPNYQWRKDGEDIAGATTGSIRAVLPNAWGTVCPKPFGTRGSIPPFHCVPPIAPHARLRAHEIG
jgi:alpha-tubulin suppressor-like RCC1 family protein